MNVVEAISDALALEMERDRRVILIGLDIGALGGVFRTSVGLLDQFGERRVVNMPLAEGAIVGASLGLAILLLLRMLLLHAQPIIAHPLVEGVWEELSESLIFVAGAWIIFSMLAREKEARASFGNVRAGQILFALALPAIGLSHFFYLNLTAPLIPSWLPFHVSLAYFTGAAWIAAALAILSGVLARLAAMLTAVMVSLFTVLVWVPMVIAAPTSRGNWSELCVSAAITGAAWAVAESLGGSSWVGSQAGQ